MVVLYLEPQRSCVTVSFCRMCRFALRTKLVKNRPKINKTRRQAPATGGVVIDMARFRQRSADVRHLWACGYCTFLNARPATVCASCNHDIPVATPSDYMEVTNYITRATTLSSTRNMMFLPNLCVCQTISTSHSPVLTIIRLLTSLPPQPSPNRPLPPGTHRRSTPTRMRQSVRTRRLCGWARPEAWRTSLPGARTSRTAETRAIPHVRGQRLRPPRHGCWASRQMPRRHVGRLFRSASSRPQARMPMSTKARPRTRARSMISRRKTERSETNEHQSRAMAKRDVLVVMA